MNWYFKLIANYPYRIIIAVGAFSVIALLISVTRTKAPNFSDPQLGFETRGTIIAKRLTTWDNLNEAVRPSGILTVNPVANILWQQNDSANKFLFEKTDYKGKILHSNNVSFSPVEKNKNKIDDDLDEENNSEDWLLEDNEEYMKSSHDHEHLSDDGFFCEGLSPEYSHLVLEMEEPNQSLLSFDALHSVCVIQKKLMDDNLMSSICQTVLTGLCCNPWSLPNYITLLYNHTSCLDIVEEDIKEMEHVLLECAKYYHNLQLRSDCHESNLCHGIPSKCTKYNAVYNILYYLTDVDFLSANHTHFNHSFLNHTMIFLPIARSSAILSYYYSISSSYLQHGKVYVSAMDLGLKNALFNECLVRDAFLMMAGGAFMIFCIWSYTNSMLITISTLLAIVMSLVTSYFVYTFLFKIKFFPFMNLLAIIVAIGIGADDAFIFHKMWQHCKIDKGNSSIVKLVSNTLRHSSASMFVTSLTTAAAFYSSYISSITAINCFSIFAGTAVLANFLLMVTWLPACFVISQNSGCLPLLPHWQTEIKSRLRTAQKYAVQMRVVLERCLTFLVVRFNWFWLIILTNLAIGSIVVVLHYPKLKLPDSRTFHLFQSSNLFERYEADYKEKFWFEKLKKESGWDDTNFKLPLRFVWGVLPVDNGNFLEPSSKGTLEFDSTFDMAAPESQEWLLNFCRKLRTQAFYQPTLGPLLTNCFIELFKNWMQRRCKDVIEGVDRTPCCESSRFPYSRDIFQSCIVEAIGNLYKTPADYLLPGVAGPKFSKTEKDEIKVVVVEYDSNHSHSMSFKDMHDFYTEVESWFQKELSSAPSGMKNGWFVSHLEFYDLQLALSQGTALAIGVSMAVSLAVFFLVSLNVLISIYTIVTISCIIFVTVALLVLIGWRLNVLESVAVTTAIGLAVDFSLHYGINYRLFVKDCRESAVRFTLSRMGGPTLMAALTTGAAGLFMLPSSVLPYIQIGVFLVTVMGSSWLYSTLFLMSLLSVIGPKKDFGQFSYGFLVFFIHKNGVKSRSKSCKGLRANIPADSIIDTVNIDEENAVQSNEVSELEVLTHVNMRTEN